MTRYHVVDPSTTCINTRQYKSATSDPRGNLMSTKNRTRRTTTRNIRFPNQMIEQINIALEQKGSGISQPGSLKPAVRTTSKKAYTSIKSDEE